jgi:hypothetical protein
MGSTDETELVSNKEIFDAEGFRGRSVANRLQIRICALFSVD